jgi:hypothetical protein
VNAKTMDLLVCPGLPDQNTNFELVLGLLPGLKSIQIPGGEDVPFNDKCPVGQITVLPGWNPLQARNAV